MGLFDALKPRKQKTLLDAFQEDPIIQQQRALFDALNKLCEGGCDTDQIPGGRGEFGHDLSNPIPTQTVFGSTSYLARLRLPDGAKVIYERIGSFQSPVTPNPVDGYEISHPDGRRVTKLYLSPYQKRTSERAPSGFRLLKTILSDNYHADCRTPTPSTSTKSQTEAAGKGSSNQGGPAPSQRPSSTSRAAARSNEQTPNNLHSATGIEAALPQSTADESHIEDLATAIARANAEADRRSAQSHVSVESDQATASTPKLVSRSPTRQGSHTWTWVALLLLVGGAILQSHFRLVDDSTDAGQTAQAGSSNTLPCVAEQANPGIYRVHSNNLGVAPLQILTPVGHNYFVKIVDATSGTPILTLFAHGGMPVKVDVPLGAHRVRYAYGSTWCGETNLFGTDTRFAETDKVFEFSFDGYQYTGYTIELIPRHAGNLRTKDISAKSF